MEIRQVMTLAALTVALGCSDSESPDIRPDNDKQGPQPSGGAPPVPDGGGHGIDGTGGGGANYTMGNNGSRLRMRFFLGADGSRQFSGWYDTQLGVNCQVLTAADGKLRCLPKQAAFQTKFYADPQCTQPSIWVNDLCEQHGEYLTLEDACFHDNHPVYRLGEKINISYQKGYNSCNEAGNTSNSYVSLGEVDASQFVEMTDSVQ